jgi:hypothetical protein
MTRWGKEVTPANVHPEYPRPQLVRLEKGKPQWQNLNGLWDYAIRAKNETQPPQWDGQILVPFPVESALSGVMKPVGEPNAVWYHRSLKLSKPAGDQRLLLHFGAVDWQATIYVNGTKVGMHEGGYDPFQFDITSALKATGEQDLVVRVTDPTDKGTQPRGKQVLKPGGIFYTAVTGIWQTVWLETVPEQHIAALKIVPDLDGKRILVTVQASDAKAGGKVTATLLDKGTTVATAEGLAGEPLALEIKTPKPWSPDDPFLYGLKVELAGGDAVESYAALRKISLGKDEQGIPRLLLNNKPLFQYGPLDQGWWPDGLYTPPSDAALKSDVEMLKKLGCNMIRKHVKVEPDRWYYDCDQLGIMVWQDMPSGDRGIGGNDPDLKRSPASAAEYEREWTAIIHALESHPCIVMWVPFNEGWGQFDTARIVDMTHKLDPSRLVDNASGWTDRHVGDVSDMHNYPGPGMPRVEERRAAVLGEFGGLGLAIHGHLWAEKNNWGYVQFKNKEDLGAEYLQMMGRLRGLIGQGLCAAVYTQTTDVEGEVNGMMTYDREVLKLPEAAVTAAHRKLYLPPPRVEVVLATSQHSPQMWKTTGSKPADDWFKPGFDDSKWTSAGGGFGTKGTPGAVIGTEWKSQDLWLRRSFELKDAHLTDPQWLVHHDDDAEIYLNGEKVASLAGYTSSYAQFPLSEKARGLLKSGSNTVAIHVHQNAGGQFIDAGIVNVQEQSEK